MKKNHIYWVLTLLLLATSSCNEYLDVNTNPNAPTSVSAQLVLPQAIVGSAYVAVEYNNYGGHFGGYLANAGGFSGFGNLLNYNIVPGDYNGLWVTTYDNLEDYKYVIEQTEGIDEQSYSNAVAKIMTALNYQRLVDAFGDVPYSEALQGNGNRTPKYDAAATIYQDLVNQLDNSIAIINNAKAPIALNSSSDPMFSGNMNNWKQFANTLKLRLLVRMSGVSALSSFVTTKFAALDRTLGFISSDVLVNPGYVKQDGKQNPMWNAWGYQVAGALANARGSLPNARIPTQFIYGFYKGQKLTDNGRGSVIFKNFSAGTTPVNQLGNEVNAPTIITNYPTWYTGTYSSASSISNALGILKGPSMGQPIMLAAESYFLQAEAQLKGYLTGDVTTSFNQGITQSFTYLYKDVTNVVSTTKNVATDVAAYKTDNANSYLVNISMATNNAQRLEAIITQKYIAVNMINSDEGWNEFRRTGYPVTNPTGNGYTNIASNKSNSTRADKLISRVLYPATEQSYNAANYRTINQFADLIFWDPN